MKLTLRVPADILQPNGARPSEVTWLFITLDLFFLTALQLLIIPNAFSLIGHYLSEQDGARSRVNSLVTCYASICQSIKPSLIDIIACHLVCARLLPNCHLDPSEQTSI